MTDQRGDRGQRYDAAMRSLVEPEPDVALRVLGLPPAGSIEVLPASFPSSTVTVDLLLRIAPGRLMQVEYQHVGEPGFVDRMLVYRGLIQRAHPGHRLSQHVIVLRDRTITGHDDQATHGFSLDLQVIHLRDLDPEFLLADPGTAALATLGRGTTGQRAQSYGRALDVIGAAGGERMLVRLEQATILATIRLDRPTIERTMEEGHVAQSIGMEIMQAVVAKHYRTEGRTEGLTEGREEILAEAIRTRFGDRPGIDDVARSLSERPAAEAYRAILSAADLDDVLTAATTLDGNPAEGA